MTSINQSPENRLSDTHTTLVHRIHSYASSSPDALACTFTVAGQQQTALTYAMLDQQARAIAISLRSKLNPGDRALLLYPPGVEFVSAFLGCLYAGVIAVPAYPPDPMRLPKTLPRLAHIADDADIAIWLAPEMIISLREMLFEDLPQLKETKYLATDQVDPQLAESWSMPPLDSDSLAFFQYTSGSTRAPRGVKVSHGNIRSNVTCIHRVCGHTEGVVFASWLPSYHDMGLVGMVFCPLWLGGTAHLMSPLEFLQMPLRWLQLIDQTRAHTSGGPNFGFELCIQKTTPAQRAALDLSRWKIAFNGAEPIRASTMEQFAQAFAPSGFSAASLFPCYGLAEVTLFAAGGPKQAPPIIQSVCRESLAKGQFVPVEEDNAISSVPLVASGQPATPEVEIKIVDPHTQLECPPQTIGEIWLHGSSNAHGYWKASEENAHLFSGTLRDEPHGKRYLCTGDLGCIYEDQLYVTGRKKDLLIVRGVNLYPHDLEYSAELSHELVRSGCVAAFALEEEDRIAVVCEVKQLPEDAQEGIFDAIQQKVFEDHGVRLAQMVLLPRGELPKTSSGKLQRRRTREMLMANALPTLAQRCTPRLPHHEGQTPMASAEKSQAEAASPPSSPPPPSFAPQESIPLSQQLLQYTRQFLHSRGFTEEISPETGLHQELALDSLALADLVSSLEHLVDRSVSLEHAVAQEKLSGLFALFEEAPSSSGATQNPHTAKILEEVPQLGCIVEQQDGRMVRIDGRWVADFASANYLGLDLHPDVIASIEPSLRQWGVHPSWTRAVASPQIYDELERTLATFVEAPETLVFPTVTLLHLGVLPLLTGRNGVLLVDVAAHNSIQEAAQLARGQGADVRHFAHGDLDALETLLASYPQHKPKVIAVDGVYSMSGAFAPLPALSQLAQKYNAQLYVDDAHGFGVVGSGYQGHPQSPGAGNGLVGYYGMNVVKDRIIYVGGMSKAFSSLAAFVTCVDVAQKRWLSTASSWVFSGPCPTASLQSALAGLQVNQREGRSLRAQLLQNTQRLVEGARKLGLIVENYESFPLVGVVTGGLATSVRACQLLWEHKILLTPGLFPATPIDRGLMRFTLTAQNTSSQIDALLHALTEASQQLPLPRAASHTETK